LDLESLSPKPDKPQEVYTNALTHVASSRLTDAELVYTPSQIALACMHLASPSLATLWYRSKHPTAIDVAIDAPLPHPIPAVEALISSRGRAPPVEAVREVDRRLKLCKNPEKVEGSKAYLAKQAELEKKAEIKRKKKAASVRIAMEEGDPFGEPLEKLTPAAGADDDDDDDD
jgi:cyclin H